METLIASRKDKFVDVLANQYLTNDESDNISRHPITPNGKDSSREGMADVVTSTGLTPQGPKGGKRKGKAEGGNTHGDEGEHGETPDTQDNFGNVTTSDPTVLFALNRFMIKSS